ncbi:unnamed protein product, partial [Ectocarpus sp. 12 AP-2014]
GDGCRGHRRCCGRRGVGGGGGADWQALPPLYFASVDIKHCYDTVDQARLMDIVRPLVTSEDYVVQKYTKSHPFKAMGRVQVNHVKEAVAMEDLVQFQTRCEELADESVDTIFTDQVVYGIVNRNDVLDMVDDHIKHNVVRVPAAGGSGKGAYFRQAVGIPQGSVLSGLLCNYFFGHIEKRLLGDVLDGGGGGGGGGARGLSSRAVGLESRSNSIGGGSGGQDEGAASSFGSPTGEKRARPGGREGEGEGEGEGERPPKFARISSSCSCLGDAAALDSDRASRGGVLGVPNGRGGGGSDGNRGPHETPRQQSCRSTANRNGRGHGSCGPVDGERGGERCRLGGDVDDGQRGRGPAEREESGGERPFPDPEGDCTLLRQVDDFLLISTSKAKAESFVRVMHDEVKTGDWGFSVHQAKTLVNFDMVLESRKGGGGPGQQPVRRKVRRVEGDMFPWCGVRFDTRTCEVMANYSRYSKAGVAESLTVDSRRAGACLVGKMKRYLSPKCHALMLDEGEHLGINSRNTVLLNVYEMLLVCAAKTATSALRLPRGPAGNASLLSNGALETTAYAYSLIQSRSNRRKGSFGTSRGVRCVCKIHRFEVTWLGLHAFREVFGAFARQDRGFARCKLDVERALTETAGSRGGGFEGLSRKMRKGRGGAAAAGWGEGATPDTQHGVRRGRAYDRLRRVVRSPDALSLLQTLTL